MAKLPFPIYLDAIEPLGRADLGDYQQLFARVRAGKATPPELDYVVDIAEGIRKRPAHRQRSYQRFERDLEIYDFVQSRFVRGKPWKDAATFEAAKKYEMSEANIRRICGEMEDAMDGRPSKPRLRKKKNR